MISVELRSFIKPDKYKELIEKYNNILHTDLNIRNILLNEDSSVYIIDFDKCFIKPMKKEDKEKIVNRLLRSFIKEKTKKSAYFEEEKFELLKKEALS